MAEFEQQINDKAYDMLLKYHNHELSAAVIEDADNCLHILFYDSQFIVNNFHNMTHMFVDATFSCRPNINDCYQFLNVLGVLSNRVGIVYILLLYI